MVSSNSAKRKEKAEKSGGAVSVLDAAMELYKAGEMRVSDIAARFHVSSATISMRAKKLGLPPKPRGRWRNEKPSAKQQAMLNELKQLSGAEVARRNGVSRQRVHQVAKRWPDTKQALDHGSITELSSTSVATADGRRIHVISFRLTLGEVSALVAERNAVNVKSAASVNQVARAVVTDFLGHKKTTEKP